MSNKKRNIETVKETHERLKMPIAHVRVGVGGKSVEPTWGRGVTCGAHVGVGGNLWSSLEKEG